MVSLSYFHNAVNTFECKVKKNDERSLKKQQQIHLKTVARPFAGTSCKTSRAFLV